MPSFVTRRFLSSSAALLVKVIVRMFQGRTPLSISFATLAIRTVVLPLPAPARTRSGPSLWFTASIWRGFKVSYEKAIGLPPVIIG